MQSTFQAILGNRRRRLEYYHTLGRGRRSPGRRRISMNSAREEVAAIEVMAVSRQRASFAFIESVGPSPSDTSGHLHRGGPPSPWESWRLGETSNTSAYCIIVYMHGTPQLERSVRTLLRLAIIRRRFFASRLCRMRLPVVPVAEKPDDHHSKDRAPYAGTCDRCQLLILSLCCPPLPLLIYAARSMCSERMR